MICCACWHGMRPPLLNSACLEPKMARVQRLPRQPPPSLSSARHAQSQLYYCAGAGRSHVRGASCSVTSKHVVVLCCAWDAAPCASLWARGTRPLPARRPGTALRLCLATAVSRLCGDQGRDAPDTTRTAEHPCAECSRPSRSVSVPVE